MMDARAFVIMVTLVAALVPAPRDAAAANNELDAFVAEVVARNPSLRARALRRDAFRSEASAADLWPDPSVSVMVDRVPDRGEEMPMVQYQLSQMVPWPGKLGLMRDAIDRQGDAAAAEVEVRRLELVLEAKRAFLMLLMNTRLREVNRASRELAVSITSIAVTRYATATGGHHEVTRAQVEEAALEVESLNLDGERVSIVAMLNALRDRPPARPIPDPTQVETPPVTVSVSALTERALRLRPELKVMAAMRSEAQAMGDLARRERFPDLMTSVWYNQMKEEPDTVGLMLGVTVPIFGATRQSRRATAFDRRAAGAGEDLTAMKAMIRFELADAHRKVDTATREIDLLRKLVLPRANDSFASSLAAFAAGTADVVVVLDARRALQSTARAIEEAQVRREIAVAELARAAGGAITVER
jgi:outer membrane protein, heavy metal efflux system